MRTNIYKSFYVVCLNNQGYEASLEFGKIYKVIPDLDANKDFLIRVIDESMEDYLYSSSRFAPIEPPVKLKRLFKQKIHL